MIKMIKPLICGFLFFFAGYVFPQGTLEDYKRAEKFLRQNVEKLIFHTQINPSLVEGAESVWYKSHTREGKRFIIFDVKEMSERPAFDHSKLAQALSTLMKKKYKPGELPFDRFEFIDKGSAVTFKVGKEKIKCRLDTYQCEKIKDTPKSSAVKSPDGKWEAFVKDHNLYIRPSGGGEERQLTTDGAENYPYGTSWAWYHLMNESDPSKTKKVTDISLKWSPDSRRFVTHRVDYRNAQKMYLYQSDPDTGYRAQVWSYYRSLPGELHGTLFEYYIFDIQTKTKTRLKIPSLHSVVNRDFPTWFKDSQRLHFSYYKRGYKTITLSEIDAQTGTGRTVIEETAPTYVDTSKRFIAILGEGKEVVWGSERDGWSHLYLYDWRAGKLKNRITKGRFVVREIISTDQKERRIYFMAGGREPGRDPYLPHLYGINLDGTDLKLLTPENAYHQILFTPETPFVLDTYSRVDLPPVSVLRWLRDGKVVFKFETADIKDLIATGWTFPEPFKVKARDNKTDIYGAIFRPSNFDPAKTYPVIDATYSGPHAVKTPKTFRSGCLNTSQSIAELGFIVITIDGLGTANRSKQFQDFSYRNLGDIGGPDHMAGMKQLARK
ncbi:MAG: hypothetical protein GY940_18675, partial [bacterium]|nr:hypothetical protein [bacterium]